MKKALSIILSLLALGLVIVFIIAIAKSISNDGQPKTETSTTPVAHVHAYAEDWTTTDDYHWHKATCEHEVTKDKAMHDFDDGVIEQPATESEHGVKKYTCQTCGFEKREAIHFYEDVQTDVVFSSGDRLIESRCTVCGIQNPFGDKVVHTYSEDWQSDDNSHWHEATCEHEVTTEKEEHTFVDGYCSTCKRPQNGEE